MDVVIYSEINDGSAHKRVGAIQENGRLTPLSVWSTEPAFGESLELLVDEDDMVPGLGADDVVIHSIIPEDSLSYGSRQVGGGKGPGNPHGYVDRKRARATQFVSSHAFLKTSFLVLQGRK